MTVHASGLHVKNAQEQVRIMLVDDSRIARSVIGGILRADTRFTVIDAVESGYAALNSVHLADADIIILDVEMPGLSGLDAMPLLAAKAPAARIFILSSVCENGGTAAIRALAQGAVGVMSKPGRTRISGRFGAELCAALASVMPALQPDADEHPTFLPAVKLSLPASENPSAHPALRLDRAERALAIGASTGGIAALQTVLQNLTEKFAGPIFVSQHLPNDFIPYFATELQKSCTFPVIILESGTPILHNHIYVLNNDTIFSLEAFANGYVAQFAPPGNARAAAGLDLAESCIDRMFATLATAYGAETCAVILSGMGRDGAHGAAQVKRAGGTVIVQDQSSAAVWGMPGAVVQSGLADAILHPAQIAAAIFHHKLVR